MQAARACVQAHAVGVHLGRVASDAHRIAAPLVASAVVESDRSPHWLAPAVSVSSGLLPRPRQPPQETLSTLPEAAAPPADRAKVASSALSHALATSRSRTRRPAWAPRARASWGRCQNICTCVRRRRGAGALPSLVQFYEVWDSLTDNFIIVSTVCRR